MGTYRTLRGQIVTLLQGITMSGAAALAEVATVPKSQFTGTPAATVLPASVDAQIETYGTNLRNYGFTVNLVYPINSGDSWTTAIDTLMDLSDLALTAFDTSNDLNNQSIVLEAADLAWDISVDGDNLALIASIPLVAKVSVNI